MHLLCGFIPRKWKVTQIYFARYMINFWTSYTENTLTKNDATNYLSKHGHLLKWKEYKENIFEIGCADGYITRKILYPYIENHVEKIKAVDLSETMIELAKRNNDVGKIEFEAMDMSDDKGTKDMKDKFDHIFSFYCMQYILDQRFLMERLYKILKPGGQIFATVITHATIHDTLKKHLKDETWSKYLPKTFPFVDYGDDPKQYMQHILEQAGFEVQLCEHEDRINKTNDVRALARGLVGMNPFLKSIPKEMQEEYVEEHVKAYCDASIQLGDPNKIIYGSLIFVVSKK